MKFFFTLIIFSLLIFLSFSLNAQTWSAAVNPVVGTEGPPSQLLVVNGNPAIVYYDESDLKYVRSTDAYGISWGAPVTVEAGDVGPDFSIQIVNGNPAVSYYDLINGDLKYARALDASGTAWGTSITVDAVGTVGGTNSLQLINGNPAIGYLDSTNKGLKYIRSLDASGTSWGRPVTIEAGRVSATGDLQVVNGNPAINYVYFILQDNFSFSQIDSSYLKYGRATDASGTTWGTPVRLDASWNYNLRVGSFRVVNGNPAIAYDYDGDITGLKYSRSADASGAFWATPIVVPTDAYAAIQPSLQIINGNPAIAYYDYYYRQVPGVRNDLKYVRATDASGMTWGTPLIVDATGDVGYFSSLQEVMGSPAISYYDRINRKLKYMGPPPPASTTTTLTSSLNPSTFGQTVTFTATVNTASGTPTGTVTFFDGTTNIGTGTLSSNTAAFTTSSLATGSHSITATYSGNGSYAASTSSLLVQLVNAPPPATTTTSITSSANPSTFGQIVIFAATVSAASGTPTGTVTFFDGATNIGSAMLSGNTVTFSTSGLTPGSHNITAVFNGSTNFSGSSSSVLIQLIDIVGTANTLHIYPNPVTNGIVYLQMRNMLQGNYSIRLVNNLGQTILTKQFNTSGTGTEPVQLGKKVKDVYYIEVIKPDKSKFTSKIIIY